MNTPTTTRRAMAKTPAMSPVQSKRNIPEPKKPATIPFGKKVVTRDNEQALEIISILEQAEKHQDTISATEKYAYLTEYGTQVLCLIHPKNGADYISRNFSRVTGHKDAAYKKESFFGIIHSDYQQRFKDILAKGIAADKPQPFRCKLRHADDSWQWYQFIIHSRNSNDGRYICVIDNIHDTIATQNTLQKAKLEAELALRARSDFLANMSHDLRTPLNAVIGFSQLVQSEVFGKLENPHYSEYIKHIKESGYDLLSKVEDLLDISSIDAGRIELEKNVVTLEDLAQNAIRIQQHHAQAGGVTLEAKHPKREIKLYIDRAKVQHILSHVMANAIRHSRRGTKVLIESVLSSDHSLIVRISDDGTGMGRDKLKTINSALKQDNCWMAKSNNELGLGLALTKEFMDLHGGSVQIISKSSIGTTVYLNFPTSCVFKDQPEHPALEEHPKFAHLLES